MRFSQLVSLVFLSSSALAAIKNVQIYISSENVEVFNLGVNSIYEEEGVEYLYLTETAGTYLYDDETLSLFKEIQVDDNTAVQYFGIGNGFLQFSLAAEGVKVNIDETGAVTFDGSDSVYAGKNVSDPLDYSIDSYFLVSAIGEDAIQVTFSAVFEEVSDEVPSATESATEIETETAIPSIIAGKTVTVYTTWCPEPTTLTLTICDTICSESHVTVESAGPVTIADVAIDEESYSIESIPTEFPEVDSEETELPSEETEAPEINTYEGHANKLNGGSILVAVAVAAGLLI